MTNDVPCDYHDKMPRKNKLCLAVVIWTKLKLTEEQKDQKPLLVSYTTICSGEMRKKKANVGEQSNVKTE